MYRGGMEPKVRQVFILRILTCVHSCCGCSHFRYAYACAYVGVKISISLLSRSIGFYKARDTSLQ